MTQVTVEHEMLLPPRIHDPETTLRVWGPPAGKLTLNRQDVVFCGAGTNRLHLEVTLRGTGPGATTPTLARISVAPLGAFVPWRPVLALPVAAIPPGAATTLRAEILRSRSGRRPPSRRLSLPLRLYLRSQGVRVSRRESHVAWAGNVNVFVHDTSVERHTARFPGLVPGTMNMMDFVVGSSRPDAYRFELSGDIALREVTLHPAGLLQRRLLPFSSWIEFQQPQLLWLCAKTSRHAVEGHLQVHVRQRSSGREAIVEFGFRTRGTGIMDSVLRPM